MRSQLRCRRHTTAEPEQDVQEVEEERQERVDDEALAEGGGDEVEQRGHAEDGHEEVVVDDAAVAPVPLVDHVSHQGHYEEGPEELFVRMGLLVSVLERAAEIGRRTAEALMAMLITFQSPIVVACEACLRCDAPGA
jgi:hypothetical protein